jgi:biotin synthase
MTHTPTLRHDWHIDEVLALFDWPFNDLIYQAQGVHRQHFNANQVQLSTLLNIKSGACSEDCAYCSQSARFKTQLAVEPLMALDEVLAAAKQAQAHGSQRLCMGAAWRQPNKAQDFIKILKMVKEVKALGLETCLTLGMLTEQQVAQLQAVGLDYYNHNLDTSENFYPHIISTRQYQDRLDTLARLQHSDIKVCSGGIIGMGESISDRAQLLLTLANLPKHPESVPINQWVKVDGTPLATELADQPPLDGFDMVRCIAVARILMPASYVRLSAGRSEMSQEIQALCFLAGANAIFYGEKLLTTINPSESQDQQLLAKLGINAGHLPPL